MAHSFARPSALIVGLPLWIVERPQPANAGSLVEVIEVVGLARALMLDIKGHAFDLRFSALNFGWRLHFDRSGSDMLVSLNHFVASAGARPVGGMAASYIA